jgi:hypothetical protein
VPSIMNRVMALLLNSVASRAQFNRQSIFVKFFIQTGLEPGLIRSSPHR